MADFDPKAFILAWHKRHGEGLEPAVATLGVIAAAYNAGREGLTVAAALLKEESDKCVCIQTPILGKAGSNIKQEELCPKGQECWWCRVRTFLKSPEIENLITEAMGMCFRCNRGHDGHRVAVCMHNVCKYCIIAGHCDSCAKWILDGGEKKANDREG